MLPVLIAVAQGSRFPVPTVPAGWGVNIHFTDEAKGEAGKIGAAFRWVRMDFAWSGTERERGKYDFAAYDRLLTTLEHARVRPYFILDYGNDLYQTGSPRTPESRAAFCRWVAAAMARFRGRGIVWEMWNEPNGGFWQPKANVAEYIALARAVGETIRKAAPGEILVGPATSGFDWPFLQSCLDAGLLKYWDAVSVHPYRQAEPESVVVDWLRLREMIERAAPGRSVPMISGEWGYSELFTGQTKELQGRYVVRQYLANLSCGVPISIYYDWKDDGTDPKDPEAHFGTVLPDLSPKPAYEAATRLVRELGGFSFVGRLYAPDPHWWLLLFRRGSAARLVVWTTGEPGTLTLGKSGLVQRGGIGVSATKVPIDNAPTVLAWLPLDALLKASPQVWAKADPFRLSEEPGVARSPVNAGSLRLERRTLLYPVAPLALSIRPERDGSLVALVENPHGRKMGEAKIWELRRWHATDQGATLGPGTAYPYRYPLTKEAFGVAIEAPGAAGISLLVPRFVPVSMDGASAVADGDNKIRGAVSASPGTDGTRLAYDFDPGWRFAELRLPDAKVDGRPNELGMWIDGDGSGDLLRMRYSDATGQTFQPAAKTGDGTIDWKGWRYVTFPLDGSGGRWGGANDGIVHYPIRIGTLALVDMPGGRGGKGAIKVARPALAYDG